MIEKYDEYAIYRTLFHLISSNEQFQLKLSKFLQFSSFDKAFSIYRVDSFKTEIGYICYHFK